MTTLKPKSLQVPGISIPPALRMVKYKEYMVLEEIQLPQNEKERGK